MMNPLQIANCRFQILPQRTGMPVAPPGALFSAPPPQSEICNLKSEINRGISLLEVLIAIVILGIGLLGIGALLPLGQTQMSEGTVQDRAAYYGLYALRQVKVGAPLVTNSSGNATGKIGSMVRPDNWFAWNTAGTAKWDNWSNVVSAAPGSLQPSTVTMPTVPPTSVTILPALTATTAATAPICVAIDPLLIARNSGGVLGGVTYPDNSSAVGTFPYNPGPTDVTTPVQWMKRVTLFNQSTAAASSTAIALAEQTFLSHDDLLFDTSSGSDKKPFWPGSLIPINSTTGVPPAGVVQKRPFEGEYSWMATLVPATGSDGVVLQNQFTLSVVVFYQRTCLLDLASERQVTIAFSLVNSGYGGLSVQFDDTLSQVVGQGQSANVKPGDWLMLGTLAPYLDSSGATVYRQVFKWYRVVGVGAFITGSRTVSTATLQGPDWNSNWRINGTVAATATFAKGVVGVYERTIRIDSPSLWSQ